jgi:3-phosphoshikimate 1-carboxyvinyltransferase
MGATIRTREGTAPMTIEGGELHSVDHRLAVPSAQIKGAVLLAGLDADGTTTIEEPAPTRDHTERAIRALGGPVKVEGSMISVSRFQHEGFTGIVPGDPSSAAFLVAAAASTGGELTIEGVGLNPSRLHYLDVLARMGVRTEQRIDREQMGEPVGDLWVGPCDGLVGTAIDEDEIPLVIDEIPIIAAVATSASGDTTFAGAGELRVKESDRLAGMADGIVALGGGASVQGDDLVVAGGGLEGGRAQAGGDHRMAMAFAVAGTAARAAVEVDGIEVADVSFPGFVETLTRLGASFEVTA